MLVLPPPGAEAVPYKKEIGWPVLTIVSRLTAVVNAFCNLQGLRVPPIPVESQPRATASPQSFPLGIHKLVTRLQYALRRPVVTLLIEPDRGLAWLSV